MHAFRNSLLVGYTLLDSDGSSFDHAWLQHVLECTPFWHLSVGAIYCFCLNIICFLSSDIKILFSMGNSFYLGWTWRLPPLPSQSWAHVVETTIKHSHFLPGHILGDISLPPLPLGVTIWLRLYHWTVSESDVYRFWAKALLPQFSHSPNEKTRTWMCILPRCDHTDSRRWWRNKMEES